MNELIIHHRSVWYEQKCKCENDIEINVRSEIQWKGHNDTEKTRKVFIDVTGSVIENERKCKKTLIFEWPDDNILQLKKAIEMVAEWVNGSTRKDLRSSNGEFEREVHVNVYNDWLRVGWVDKNKNYYGYILFKSGDVTFCAKFKDIPNMMTSFERILSAAFIS